MAVYFTVHQQKLVKTTIWEAFITKSYQLKASTMYYIHYKNT